MISAFRVRRLVGSATGSSRRASLTTTSISEVLKDFAKGSLSLSDAEKSILELRPSSRPPPEDTLEAFANLDHSRAHRTGFPEVVFGQGKTPHQIAKILDSMAERGNDSNASVGAARAILATRVSSAKFDALVKIPLKHGRIQYHAMARMVAMTPSSQNSDTIDRIERPRVVVATAGTTDLPVAEEAAITLEAAGCEVDRITDVGVAGLHRILEKLPRLKDPAVGAVIVCAGMDGALPSVVGGLVDVPVIATPTSVGYGASFGGVSALLTMLNSCSPGVGVVNIDNGVGAAALAYKCIR